MSARGEGRGEEGGRGAAAAVPAVPAPGLDGRPRASHGLGGGGKRAGAAAAGGRGWMGAAPSLPAPLVATNFCPPPAPEPGSWVSRAEEPQRLSGTSRRGAATPARPREAAPGRGGLPASAFGERGRAFRASPGTAGVPRAAPGPVATEGQPRVSQPWLRVPLAPFGVS